MNADKMNADKMNADKMNADKMKAGKVKEALKKTPLTPANFYKVSPGILPHRTTRFHVNNEAALSMKSGAMSTSAGWYRAGMRRENRKTCAGQQILRNA